MKFQFEPILPDVPENLRWIYEGNTLYVDPEYSPDYYIEQLDVLPLLVDKVIVFDPTRHKLRNWNYPLERFSSLVENQVFVPLFLHREEGFQYKTCISREDLLPDEFFFCEYDKAVDEDLGDAELVRIVESLGLDLHEIAFSLNWDLIVAQVFRSPILITSNLEALWQHKFRKVIYDVSAVTDIPESVKKSNVLDGFFYRTIRRLPIDLSVDEILEFRNDKSARGFRKWFGDEINKTMKMSNITDVLFDEEMYRDFNELLSTYNKKMNLASATITGIVAAVVGVLAGPLASLPSIGGPLLFPRIIKTLWKKFGPNNWIFVVLDLKKTKSC